MENKRQAIKIQTREGFVTIWGTDWQMLSERSVNIYDRPSTAIVVVPAEMQYVPNPTVPVAYFTDIHGIAFASAFEEA